MLNITNCIEDVSSLRVKANFLHDNSYPAGSNADYAAAADLWFTIGSSSEGNDYDWMRYNDAQADIAYYLTGDLAKAVAYYAKALEFAQKTGDKVEERFIWAVLNESWGLLMESLGKWVEAAKSLRVAVSLYFGIETSENVEAHLLLHSGIALEAEALFCDAMHTEDELKRKALCKRAEYLANKAADIWPLWERNGTIDRKGQLIEQLSRALTTVNPFEGGSQFTDRE
jgi:tetratricopeptide (TPR) repeat protein